MPYSEEYLDRRRKVSKAAQNLAGISAGITVDGSLNDAEIHYLKTWLLEHRAVMNEWPINQLARRMEKVLRDNTITEESRADLLSFLQSFSGNYYLETGAAAPEAAFTGIPFDDDKPIVFVLGEKKKPCCYCLTGKFAYGNRKKCEQAVIDLGGRIVPKDISLEVDYLVVGSAGVTSSWKNETYGRKIEKAIEYREASNLRREARARENLKQVERLKPLIISEEAWVKAIQSRTERPQNIDDPVAYFSAWRYAITPHHYGIFGFEIDPETSCWLAPDPLKLDIQEGYIFYRRGSNDTEYMQIASIEDDILNVQFGVTGQPAQRIEPMTRTLLRLRLETGQ
ncbi:hypothetical protein AGMMS50256_33990 [Betaproteobacteria bacterium]|nr:hypothetical protein AGMMS50256_33990 [Betaproteobacteria bacterium]